MANFPDPSVIPAAPSMAPSYRLPETPSAEGLAQGAQNLAQGVGNAASSLTQMALTQQQQQDAVDLSRAEAYKTSKFLDIQNSFAKDADYSTFGERAEPQVDGALDTAGALIRNDATRQQWLAEQGAPKAQMLNAIVQNGQGKQQDAERGALESTLSDNADLISDPTVPQAVRDKARADMQGSIFMGQKTGLLSPDQASTLADKYVKGARNALAVNTAQLDILSNPQKVMTDLAIPTVNTGSTILAAQGAVDGGQGPAPLEFSLARMTAQQIGDSNFPDDPKLAAAYLSDPNKAMDYAEAAQAHLSDRYKGDLSAVVVAMDPNGGTALADKWVASNHDVSVLPPTVRTRYTQVMQSITAQQPYQRIPLQAAPGVDLNSIDAGVLDRFEKLQSSFGAALPVISAASDPAKGQDVTGADPSQHYGLQAVNIDVSNLNTDQRSKLIEMASSMGFNGIGVYKNSLHLDTGTLRAWGPSGNGPGGDVAISNFDASKAPGMIQPGNLNVNARPVVHNANGSYSTEYSATITTDDGKAVLISTVYNGKVNSTQDAIKHYEQTGENLGTFDTEDHADAYAEKLHSRSMTLEKSDIPAWANDAIAQHLSGTVQPIPSLYSGLAPEYKDLNFDQRLKLYDQAKQAADQGDVSARSQLGVIADNAPAAIASTGKYDGDMPTATQFVQAYGAGDGIQKYRQFESDVDTSKTLFGMKTMSNQDILATVNAATPVSSGNTAALDQKRYDTVNQAATSILKARADDPAGYTMSTYPQVAAAFQAAQNDRTLFPAALTAMSEAQKQLGIDQPALLPKAMSAQVVDTFKDATVPAQQKIAAVAGTVLASNDVGQQDQIFNQLVHDGLPGYMSGALNAMRRGDTGAAQNLMRASIADVTKQVLPNSIKDADVAPAVADAVFAPGTVGSITYGLQSGSADNINAAANANELLQRDVRLHLTDGSAGGDLNKAVQMASKDMFGDVQVLSGTGSGFMGIGGSAPLQVTIPKDANPATARQGFTALMPMVKQNLTQFMVGKGLPVNAPDGSSLALQWGVSNYVDTVMSDGYFANADGYLPAGQKGFVFMDPKSGSPVQTPQGQPLVFTMGQVLGAANAQGTVQPQQGNGAAFRK